MLTCKFWHLMNNCFVAYSSSALRQNDSQHFLETTLRVARCYCCLTPIRSCMPAGRFLSFGKKKYSTQCDETQTTKP